MYREPSEKWKSLYNEIQYSYPAINTACVRPLKSVVFLQMKLNFYNGPNFNIATLKHRTLNLFML